MTAGDADALAARKARCRRKVREALSGLTVTDVEARSLRIRGHLLELGEYKAAESVMIFVPMDRPAGEPEVDLQPLAESAWRMGKTVLVPRVDWTRREMDAVETESLDRLVTGRYGLREPADGPVRRPEEIDLIILPGLAYDRCGRRLGRGGGYYDRFLARPGVRATTCGVAMAGQVLDEVPTGQYDRPVDVLITDEGVLRFDGT